MIFTFFSSSHTSGVKLQLAPELSTLCTLPPAAGQPAGPSAGVQPPQVAVCNTGGKQRCSRTIKLSLTCNFTRLRA